MMSVHPEPAGPEEHMVQMYDQHGMATHWARNPPVNTIVRFRTIVPDSAMRYGHVAMLTDQGPNCLAEVVFVTDDKGPRKVYFLSQVQAWEEIPILPQK